MLIDSDDKGLTIVDAQGNEEVIDPEEEVIVPGFEQALRLVIIKNGLPSSLMGEIFTSWSKAITSEHAEEYRDASIAFTYQGRNHLGIIKEVYFEHGQGTLVVSTASGDKLHITSGKRGKPVVVDPYTTERSTEKFRGVVFVP